MLVETKTGSLLSLLLRLPFTDSLADLVDEGKSLGRLGCNTTGNHMSVRTVMSHLLCPVVSVRHDCLRMHAVNVVMVA